MTFPSGVQTCTLTFAGMTSFGGEPAAVTLEVTPVLAGTPVVIWTATGDTLLPFKESTSTQVEIPIVSQDGWSDAAGNTYKNWAYQLTLLTQYGGQLITQSKAFQPEEVGVYAFADLPDAHIGAEVEVGVPVGLKGEKGDKGDRGEKGDQGEPGPQGAQGPQGVVGPQGIQGPVGPQGIQGPQGEIGPQGPQGDQGPQGIQGVPGEQGPQGDIGPQGVKGDTGDQGPQGPKGDKGDQGEKGDKGDQGDQGPPGTGSGDVVGPAGATDGHMALFDGATGKLIKGGGLPLALGTTSGTAKAGDYAPASTDITDSTATGRAVLTAASAAAARTAIGAGTSNLAIGTTSTTAKAGNYQPTAANISDSTATGRAVLTAADAAAARTAIGAGTSSLAIGTTSTTAKAGDYQPTIASQANAEAGTNNTEYMTPLRTAQAIAALAGGGGKVLYEDYLTSGTTWVAPAGCTEILVEGVGGGGGGVSSSAVSGQNVCGGFGGYFRARRAVTPGQTCTYAIGAGGASVTGATGSDGGSTTFTLGAETFTAGGGARAGTSGGAGGTASGGDINIRGPRGANGVTGTTALYVSVTGHMGGWHVNRGSLTYPIAEAQGGPGSGGVSVPSGSPSNAGGNGAIRITYLAD